MFICFHVPNIFMFPCYNISRRREGICIEANCCRFSVCVCACVHTKTTQNNTTTPTPPHTRILIEYGIRIETANTNRSQQALASQPKKLELTRREHEDGARWTASPTTCRKSTEAAPQPGSLPPTAQTKEGSFAAASKTNRTNALLRKSNTNYHTRKQT